MDRFINYIVVSQQIIERAFRKSKNTPCKFKVCAICYDKGGRLLGITYNIPRFSRYNGGLHAEMRALHRWGSSIDSITLVRFGISGDLLPIKCCKNCRRVLSKFDIKVNTLV